MLEIYVTSEHRYRVVYRLDGVVCSVVECAELKTAQQEITHKLTLMMGLMKGKTFVTYTGKEL